MMWVKYQMQMWVANPILRAKSVDIEKITPDIKQLSKDMIAMLPDYDGVGLAAPQIWKNINLIVVSEFSKKKWEYILEKHYAMINPKILSFWKTKDKMEEACLSLPKIYVDIERPISITVSYQNLNWKIVKKDLSGLEARVVQHEVDHLNWILITDYQ